MKIKYALFENFLMLESGLGKHKVELDFSNMPNVINVLVGPMGSGKTTILSHLTPSAYVGTLDERNSDPIIIPDKNGLKKVIFVDGETIYEVVHKYNWTKDHHSVKSYISKNGVELNQNGNQSSFKEIVEEELGFGPDLLRLLRLGPNVANVIDLSIAERKEYVANMISSVDLYLSIYKDMRERTRMISAQTQLIAKKLSNVTEDDIDDMRQKLKKLSRKISESESNVTNLSNELASAKTEISIYLEGRSVDQYESELIKLQDSIDALSDSISKKNDLITSLSDKYGSINDVIRNLGKCDADIMNNNRLLDALNSDYESMNKKRAEMFKSVKAVTNDEYVDSIRDEYTKYKDSVESLKEFTEGFECKYTSAEINSLMASIQVLESEMSDVFEIDTSLVKTLINASSTILESSKKQVAILQARQVKLQRSLSNIKYIDQYDVSENLALPKSCKDFTLCPYFYTHPNTVKAKTSHKDVTESFRKVNEEISHIDSEIEKLLLYPTVYKKIQHIIKEFNAIAKKINDIDALKIKDIKKILTLQDHRYWYDYDKIVDTLELCVKREQLAVNESKLIELKSELDKMTELDSEKVKEEYQNLLKSIDDNRKAVVDINEATESIRANQKGLTEAYDSLLNMGEMQTSIQQMQIDKDNKISELNSMTEKYDIIRSQKAKISKIVDDLNIEKSMLNTYQSEYDSLQRKLAEIESYQKEYESLTSDLSILELIQEASSSKKGIPLFFVELFLNECVEDINEMVSVVFDDIEICEFKISDKEFKIPYIKNGNKIDDIRSASQGERAIVSIALSFALMRKGSIKYNIPLLDEVDAPIHAVEREKFLLILSEHFKKIHAEQAFIITHNDIFEGYPVNIITTGEHLDNKYKHVMRLSSQSSE